MNNKYSKELCHSQFQGDELYHHGILGMHWGVRRYQPYPKGYKGDGKYTRKERKADKKEFYERADILSAQAQSLKRATEKRNKAMGEYLKLDYHDAAYDSKNLPKRILQSRKKAYAWDDAVKQLQEKHDLGLKELKKLKDKMVAKYGDKESLRINTRKQPNGKEIFDGTGNPGKGLLKDLLVSDIENGFIDAFWPIIGVATIAGLPAALIGAVNDNKKLRNSGFKTPNEAYKDALSNIKDDEYRPYVKGDKPTKYTFL